MFDPLFWQWHSNTIALKRFRWKCHMTIKLKWFFSFIDAFLQIKNPYKIWFMQYKLFNYLFSWPLSLDHRSRPLFQTVGPPEYSSEHHIQSPSLETYRKDSAIGSLPLSPAGNWDAWSHLIMNENSQACTGNYCDIGPN